MVCSICFKFPVNNILERGNEKALIFAYTEYMMNRGASQISNIFEDVKKLELIDVHIPAEGSIFFSFPTALICIFIYFIFDLILFLYISH